MRVSNVMSGARVLSEGRSSRTPKISIVTPTYKRNAEGLLSRCLDSAVAQTFSDFELIVIDDGSSDGSQDTIMEYALRDDRIVYIRHDRNSGLPAVRTNEGVLRARGDAVAFLFDDNVFEPDFLRNAWEGLQSSGADVVHTNVKMLVKQGKPFFLGGWPLTLELLRNLNTIPNGGVLCKRDFFDVYGLYDPLLGMRRVCDWDLWLKALALGARFQHLDIASSVEWGLVSENSIGNTIAWDVKVVYGYMLDVRTFAQRAEAFRPDRIGDVDVLDPSAFEPYVRDADEWNRFIASTYDPFFAKTGYDHHDFSRPSNRSGRGVTWNEPWSIAQARKRVLVVGNAINGWAAAAIDILGKVEGQIVLNCPEWQLAAFTSADIDLLVLLDTCAQFIVAQLDAFRAGNVPVLLVVEHGAGAREAAKDATARSFRRNTHIVDVVGADMYFPQPGMAYSDGDLVGAQMHAARADLVCANSAALEKLAARHGLDLHEMAGRLADAYTLARPSVSYDLGSPPSIAEAVIAPDGRDRLGRAVRESWEGLAAVIATRPGAVIATSGPSLDNLPPLERLGVERAALARNVSINAPVRIDENAARVCGKTFDTDFRNIADATRVMGLLAPSNRSRPGCQIHIFLNSHMLSGSEVYGIMLARNLSRCGFRCTIFVPEENAYGNDADRQRLDGWLISHGLEATETAPFVAGASYLAGSEETKAVRSGALQSFLDQRQPDGIICSGYMPVFADVQSHAPVFMTLFQASAYTAAELAYLRQSVAGIMSDCQWSLDAVAPLVGVPANVVRSTFPIYDDDRAVAATLRSYGRIRVGLGGTLQPRKRQAEAIEAVAILRARGLDVELNLYGYELEMVRDYVTKIDDLTRRLGLESHVRRSGMVEMSRIAAENDIILTASIDESLPQTLGELMRMGLVAVAGLSGGIDEIVVDDHSGFLTDDVTSAGLANALARAIAARDRWPSIVANARSLIDTQYSARESTGQLLSVLERGARVWSLTRNARGVPDRVEQPVEAGRRSLMKLIRRK